MVEHDALALAKEDLSGYDAIVDGFASPQSYQHIDVAANLIKAFPEDDKTKLIFVIGSSNLEKADGTTLLADNQKQFAGASWLAATVQQSRKFEMLKWVTNVNWTAVTPNTGFELGEKTGFKLGGDQVLTPTVEDKSLISFGNFAAAILDEIEQNKHQQQRFSVINA